MVVTLDVSAELPRAQAEVPLSQHPIWKDIAEASDYAFSYVYAGMRRGISSYRREFVKGNVPGRSAKLRTRKGGLARTFIWDARPRVSSFRPDAEQKGRLEEIEIKFRSSNIVAEVLEFGARIGPRRGKYLALPMNTALRKDGRVKKEWRTPRRAQRLLGIKLFPITARNGRKYLAYDALNRDGSKSRKLRRGKVRRQRIVVVYWLSKQVVIEPQLGFYAGWDRHVAEGEVDRRLVIEFRRYLREVWGKRYPRARAA